MTTNDPAIAMIELDERITHLERERPVAVLPGDVLVIESTLALSAQQAADIRGRIMELSPDIGGVVILANGLHVAGVTRP